eukprot:jgi/Bigna1/88353/estExt_fgenesh1_pg.C_310038
MPGRSRLFSRARAQWRRRRRSIPARGRFSLTTATTTRISTVEDLSSALKGTLSGGASLEHTLKIRHQLVSSGVSLEQIRVVCREAWVEKTTKLNGRANGNAALRWDWLEATSKESHRDAEVFLNDLVPALLDSIPREQERRHSSSASASSSLAEVPSALTEVELLLNRAVACGLTPSLEVYSKITLAFAQIGMPSKVEHWVSETRAEGYAPPSESFHAVIASWAAKNDINRAVFWIEDQRSDPAAPPPSADSFHKVLKACIRIDAKQLENKCRAMMEEANIVVPELGKASQQQRTSGGASSKRVARNHARQDSSSTTTSAATSPRLAERRPGPSGNKENIERLVASYLKCSDLEMGKKRGSRKRILADKLAAAATKNQLRPKEARRLLSSVENDDVGMLLTAIYALHSHGELYAMDRTNVRGRCLQMRGNCNTPTACVSILHLLLITVDRREYKQMLEACLFFLDLLSLHDVAHLLRNEPTGIQQFPPTFRHHMINRILNEIGDDEEKTGGEVLLTNNSDNTNCWFAAKLRETVVQVVEHDDNVEKGKHESKATRGTREGGKARNLPDHYSYYRGLESLRMCGQELSGLFWRYARVATELWSDDKRKDERESASFDCLWTLKTKLASTPQSALHVGEFVRHCLAHGRLERATMAIASLSLALLSPSSAHQSKPPATHSHQLLQLVVNKGAKSPKPKSKHLRWIAKMILSAKEGGLIDLRSTRRLSKLLEQGKLSWGKEQLCIALALQGLFLGNRLCKRLAQFNLDSGFKAHARFWLAQQRGSTNTTGERMELEQDCFSLFPTSSPPNSLRAETASEVFELFVDRAQKMEVLNRSECEEAVGALLRVANTHSAMFSVEYTLKHGMRNKLAKYKEAVLNLTQYMNAVGPFDAAVEWEAGVQVPYDNIDPKLRVRQALMETSERKLCDDSFAIETPWISPPPSPSDFLNEQSEVDLRGCSSIDMFLKYCHEKKDAAKLIRYLEMFSPSPSPSSSSKDAGTCLLGETESQTSFRILLMIVETLCEAGEPAKAEVLLEEKQKLTPEPNIASIASSRSLLNAWLREADFENAFRYLEKMATDKVLLPVDMVHFCEALSRAAAKETASARAINDNDESNQNEMEIVMTGNEGVYASLAHKLITMAAGYKDKINDFKFYNKQQEISGNNLLEQLKSILRNDSIHHQQ